MPVETVYVRHTVGVEGLLLHHVAQREGFYDKENLDVRLYDETELGSGREEPAFSFDLTVPLFARLRGKSTWVALIVGSDYPLWWLVSQPDIDRPTELQGKLVSLPIPGSVTAVFSSIALAKHGLDQGHYRSLLALDPPPAGDAQAFELLRARNIEAAIVGSQFAPSLYARAGLRLLSIGDSLRFSTTGLAADTARVDVDGLLTESLARAILRALHVVQDDETAAIAAIESLASLGDRDDAEALYRRFIRPYFTPDGLPTPERCMDGLREVAAAIGPVPGLPKFTELYRADIALRARP